MAKFNERLKQLRKNADLSQQDFSKLIGVSKSSINMYERGEREPGIETIGNIADFFNVNVDYLLGKTDTKTSSKVAKSGTLGLGATRNYASHFRRYREDAGMTQEQLASELNLDVRYIIDLESGRCFPQREVIFLFCDYFGITPDFLDGMIFDRAEDGDMDAEYILTRVKSCSHAIAPRKKSEGELIFLDKQKIRLVPLYESVSAGFGTYANDCVVDYIPTVIMSETEAAETIAIKVHGDSMYPKIEDGDTIIVHKQESVDSTSVAVVLLDGEEGLVKKVIYGRDWIELHSFNPMYPPLRFEGAEVLRLRVVGLVKQVLKNI